MIKRLRHFCYGDVRRIFASCVLAASAALTVTRFRPVLLRFFWAVADLFTGIRSYVLRLAGPLFHASEEPFSHTPSSVEALPEVSYSELLGFEPAELKARLAAWWADFFEVNVNIMAGMAGSVYKTGQYLQKQRLTCFTA